MSQWETQYSLVVRWYIRSAVCADNPLQADVTEFTDYLYAFYASSWHLKDWLKADPDVEIENKVIEDYVNQEGSALKVCGDIANVAKHLKVDDPNRDSTASLNGTVHITTSMKIDGTSESDVKVKSDIVSIRGNQDALQIAKKSLEEWEGFLLEHKLREEGGLLERIDKQVKEDIQELSSPSQ